MRKTAFGLCVLVILALTACSRIPLLDRFQSQATEPVSMTPTFAGLPTMTPTPPPTAMETNTLTIWVPPQWDPQRDTEIGGLFQERVQAYLSQYPTVHVNVRMKALTGPGGILETLKTARDAAPLVLPDIVALPRPEMEQAAEGGLIVPLDEYDAFIESNNWYSFSKQLATVREGMFGIPFAADVLVFAYKSDTFEERPRDWDGLLSTQKPMAFPASDPQSLVNLAFYESLGGQIAQLNEHYVLDRSPLQGLLSFYQQANQAEVMPYWLTQFESDQQAWMAYTERQSTQVITWSSNYLNSSHPNTELGAMPTQDGKPFSYATGWMWSIVSKDPEQIELGLGFIDFLSDDEFLALWNRAAGHVPPRSSAIRYWLEDSAKLAVFEQLLPASKAIPSGDVLDQIGPPLNQAVLAVLKDQVDPEQAVSQVLEQLKSGE